MSLRDEKEREKDGLRAYKKDEYPSVLNILLLFCILLVKFWGFKALRER